MCRIADTIEDHPALGAADKRRLLAQWVAVLEGLAAAAPLCGELAGLAAPLPAGERALLSAVGRVLAGYQALSPEARARIAHCVRVMSAGMAYFQAQAGPQGLAEARLFDRYCYHVAGIVGETLTGLWLADGSLPAAHGAELMRLAPSFGQGLQMVNVLRDVPADRERGVCWLPRDVFAGDPEALLRPGDALGRAGLAHLVAQAHGHLRNGLLYTLLLPRRAVALRRFCAWALLTAAANLQRIWQAGPGYDRRAARIDRVCLYRCLLLGALAAGGRRRLRWAFEREAAGLPAAVPVSVDRRHRAIQAWFAAAG
ncbi:MAG: hypothetical protein KatS3mg121_0006 [Gammaproteobacteria bacterium]|nr:MAG: hypothetical protein KatS3mg121_0006 [Gammaproteobacteria bacterium]